MHSEQSTCKTQGDAVSEAMEPLTQARERQEEARRFYWQKCDEASATEAKFNDTMKDTLREASEDGDHAGGDADFFKTLVNL